MPMDSLNTVAMQPTLVKLRELQNKFISKEEPEKAWVKGESNQNASHTCLKMSKNRFN